MRFLLASAIVTLRFLRRLGFSAPAGASQLRAGALARGRTKRDWHQVPLPLMTERELRELVVEMRLRHHDERLRMLSAMTTEQQIKFLTKPQSPPEDPSNRG